MFDIVTPNQESLVTLIKIIIYACCLLLMLVLAAYNGLYLMKILNTNQKIGVHPPKHIHYLIRGSILLALGTALIVMLFLFFLLI